MSGLKLSGRSLSAGDIYIERFQGEGDPLASRSGSRPYVDPQASVHDCILGPWTRVGGRTSLSEVSMGAYSYIVTDSSAAYSDIGKFCSIARDVRINPGNHPTWRAAQHHFSYRAVSYELGEADDDAFLQLRSFFHSR